MREILNLTNKLIKNSRLPHFSAFIRNKSIRLPEVTKSLQEKLLENSTVDPILHFKVDIGLPPPKRFNQKEICERKNYIKKIKNNPDLEKKSRLLLLNPDLDDIKTEWLNTLAPKHIQVVADHYKIFDDLFGHAYFTPYIIMNISYQQKDKNLFAPVYRGNILKPTETFYKPIVEFQSEPKDFWSLTMVSPDGHFTEDGAEYIHWFVGNIPGNDVKSGETIWDYLPPFPARGIGFQRFIFILYKQEKKIDYSKIKVEIPCLELRKRTFRTLEFYRERQDDLTPAGLSFFQSDWDRTSKKIFNDILNMEEPILEYDHDPQPRKKQTWFPKKQPFNLYLDRYKDPRDIAQEYLLKKLKDYNPFQPIKKPFPYPKAVISDFRGMPSWLKVKELRYKAGLGRVQTQCPDEYN